LPLHSHRIGFYGFKKPVKPDLTLFASAAKFLLLALVFALAYTQSPLYTSNQNQYFLHGLARAGVGYLDQDWLANTRDPTPLFSGLIFLTTRWLAWPALYYVYYALLMGVYLYCLLRIADSLFNVRHSRLLTLIYLALLITVHSAALRFTLSQALGDNWSYLLEDGVADQRLLGLVFQPSSFGVLLVLSIYLFLNRRPFLAVLSAVLAASFHPTYLLSAASLTLAYMWITYREEHRLGKPALLGLAALLVVLPILFYVYTNFGHSPGQVVARAQEILVNFRIPHHALIRQWFDLTAAIKLLLILCALYLARKSLLFLVLLIPFAISASLTLAQFISGSNALALLFPWRVSTVLVPLSTALILAWAVSTLSNRHAAWFARRTTLLTVASLALIGAVVLAGVIRTHLDFERQTEADDRSVMAYAASKAAAGQVYLTPMDMQDFRLTTWLPVYIDFKSIPYRDEDVLEWRKRVRLANLFYNQGECGILEDIQASGVTHVIRKTETAGAACLQLHLVYQDKDFEIFRLE
jgi:hypothetical protein